MSVAVAPIDWAAYIGTPWEVGAQGPDSFDCWAFFRHVQITHFGIATPEIIAADIDRPDQLAALFSNHSERANWRRISAPVHGCAVIIHRPLHIGVWLDVDGGGVLHCVRDVGVCFGKDAAWPTSGFGRKEYFEAAT